MESLDLNVPGPIIQEECTKYSGIQLSDRLEQDLSECEQSA